MVGGKSSQLVRKCPHCGGDGLLEWNYSYKSHSWFVCVKCDMCGAQGKISRSHEEPDEAAPAAQSAIAAWNMRYKEADT